MYSTPDALARQAGARAVIVPLKVWAEKGVDDYFALVDLWLDRLLATVRSSGSRIDKDGRRGL